jgi:hypothetical protein
MRGRNLSVRNLGVRVAVVVGVFAAALMAAHDATVAAKAAAKKPPAKKPEAAAVQPAAAPSTEQTGTVSRRKAKARAKDAPDTAIMNTYANMPDAERLALQSGLAAGKGPEPNAGWRLLEDPATGARLGIPEKLVPNASASRAGSRWTSAQGQIQIETFRLSEAALPALFEEEKKAPHRQIGSSVLKPDSFAISGTQGLKNFLIRAEAKGSEVRGITILYDQATEGIMGRVAVTAASAFTGFPDPKAGLLPGMQRRVEYGTAIIVSVQGDLIAPAQLTDECQSITVPGLGHAERVATDKSSDLALLRLYGVRNLVPATLGGEGGQSTDLTLVGIADPLAQAGDAGVTSAAAHLTAQGLEPGPKLGFSGAAAVDAQGRFAGMVDLKPAVVAGSGSAGQGAAMVPVETIRTFLSAHGVSPAAPAAGQAAMNQSVLRVVCVRK